MCASFNSKKTTVFVADDSSFMRAALTRMIESDEELSVIGTARNGLEALAKISSLQPDVVTLDIDMPGMDGFEILKRVMSDLPRPIIVVSSIARGGAQATLEALELGAFDCVAKNLNYASEDVMKVQEELVNKIKAAAAAKTLAEFLPTRSYSPGRFNAAAGLGRNRAGTQVSSTATPPFSNGGGVPSRTEKFAHRSVPAIIAIGTSTGGPRALQTILSGLPATLPTPVVVVQHMPSGFIEPLVGRLNQLIALEVRQAEEGEPLLPGYVYLAPSGRHLTFRRLNQRAIVGHLSPLPGNLRHIPSVDIMMLSAAKVFQSATMGIILSGMGNDGAEGMQAIFQQGGYTLGQDQASCAVYGMPRACEERGILRESVSLSEIANRILAAHSSGFAFAKKFADAQT